MPGDDFWEISEPTTLDIDGPVDRLDLRLIDGALNVVRAAAPHGPTRVEISELEGAPLQVRRHGGSLVIGYEDMSWDTFLAVTQHTPRRRRAVVSVSVPEGVRLTAGVISAVTVVSGIRGPAEIRGVSSAVTLVGLTGPVDVRTVTGDVEGQAVSGPLRFTSASGGLTLLDGPARVEAESVSGRLMLDLAPTVTAPELQLNSVSGGVAVRFPEHSGAAVRASSLGGSVTSEFDGLTTTRGFGPDRLRGTVGDGAGRVRITTVSGTVALLRRPTDRPADAAPAPSLAKDV